MQPLPDEYPWAARWFAGEMSPTEAAELERWITADPDRAAVVAGEELLHACRRNEGGGWK